MKSTEWIALGLCFCIFSAVAFAHEEHAPPPAAPQSTQAAAPASGTRDARTWFTDTPLQDQNGETLRFYSDALENRVVLLNVIFTSCTDACPLITRKLKEVREALGEGMADKVWFVSLSSDPLNDSPEMLKAFAAKHGVDGARWLFLTGDAQDMALILGRLGHLVPSPEQHSTLLIAGDVANKRWSKIRPDAPVNAIAQRLQLLSMPLAGR